MSEAKPFSFLNPIKNPPAYVMDQESLILEVTLDVEYDQNNVFSFEKPHNVPTYTRVFTSAKTKEAGNTLTGPTIEVRPGSKLKIHTHNKLPSQDQTEPDDINFPCGFNNYNIHTHGLHVTPESPGDNVCMTIRPGEEFHYEYDIPADHPTGVYWYHPHKHGSVALQISSGMAGMIIVRGPFDDQLREMGVKEHILVFQNIAVNVEGKVEHQSPVARFPNSEYNITANSQYCPIIKVKPGELINLRLLNATTRSSINFECPFFAQMFIYGFDGNPTSDYRKQGGVSLAPANRTSVLMKINETAAPGTFYYVQNNSVKFQLIPHYKYHNNPPLFAIEVEQGEEISAAIYMPGELTERTTPPPFPKSLKCSLLEPIAPEDITNKRTLTFQANTLDETIDHSQFGGCEVANYWVELDAVEEWTLENNSELPYPIHIHVNPMYVFEFQGEDPMSYTLELPFWSDSIQVPPHGKVKFRMRFKDFTGKHPLHCHLLCHDDGGMMQHIRVVKDLKEREGWEQ
ncbi:multicopper oxidase family protein [Pseudovibrio sp. Tun.PSC04-5.I4]|uniref:multicopper oxidase family protein n=1 Tax=Pseudovibrio sp. Tun.PSC04-5.I4 TaxID=1798213 RepID=UPI00087ED8F8|nr:multicopper oxidase family protein [Pseudovibrio sp. Tun.PSC04-5.I4]SDR48593.1 Multicopper oxidase with three cupredoxin domains (includes cell division protein FtsP and spore coat protein CotA) [Pseudovibrio sp. Tun.PSC04-5.I4]